MDPANAKTNDLERRVSMRNSIRVSVIGGDDDYDDYAAGMISDGFRPTQPGAALEPTQTATSACVSASASSATVNVDSADESSRSSTSSPPRPTVTRPSSVAKPPRQPHDSFSLRHDGAMGPIHPPTGLTRSSSMSTTSTTFIPHESPYQGPSGPSHPYQMYPQNVRVARTLSVTTSSTEPVSESSYAGPRGPSHPYGLYPQDTVVDETANVPVAAIPVGFHGLPDQYQRRMGPEGEDFADIIGPDGHTEQLPPYTRYPEETWARKVRDVEQQQPEEGAGLRLAPVTAAAAIPNSNLAIPGAGGLGLAARNPEFDSTDDLSPQSRHSSRSFSSDASQHEVNTAAAEFSEKGKPQKKWQHWMRRRLWGIIPYWAICLTLGVLLVMGAILGSVIGSFLAKHKKPPHKDGDPEPDSLPAITITYDATPIPTPSDLPPLPTGTFGMPLMSTLQSSTCFNDTTQSQAWNCNYIISGMYLTVSQNTDGSPGRYKVAVNCNQSLTLANNVYAYGEQPPLIVNPVSMELVNDTFEIARGPAWFYMMPYNKTVIIPEGALTYSTSVSGKLIRDAGNGFGPVIGNFKRKGVAQAGDKPWVCNWPETFLEIFIYAEQNSSWSGFKPQPSSSSASSTDSSSSSTVTSPPTYSPPTYFPTTRPMYKSNAGGGWAQKGAVVPSSSYSPSTASTATTTGPFGPIDTGANFVPPPPPYPKVIKIEERRVSGAPEPQCTQVEIQSQGQPGQPIRDANGNLRIVTIVENEPPPPGTVVTARVQRRTSHGWHHDPFLYDRDSAADMSQCGCIWFLT
ncbi:hypothetical protein QBC46DRAFT_97577 [Diplogelasinospora grovesii]|uniref:DUF7820 domain-containing protein n=1 Tax=Diplogelasinospora grovesii TaxID=303347 RepID=A0AAN6NA43_9PEZI|nr:hypothetical protein QBC46DRAFT_97577 [Diplogelasinospora grovesii]